MIGVKQLSLEPCLVKSTVQVTVLSLHHTGPRDESKFSKLKVSNADTTVARLVL